VLIVPFDTLSRVVTDHASSLPAGLIIGRSWDNIRALSVYKGPVEIFGARYDTVIPISHAQALAESCPTAAFHIINGGHNDWSRFGRVKIRNP
jgi:pimeloyl-ACP methyl ester carboxylesterase